MKRIGLITVHKWYNYGSMLQAYALFSILDSLEDVECELIDFIPESIKDNKRSWKLYSDEEKYQDIIHFYKTEIEKRKNVFERFTSNYKLSENSYYTDEEIEKNPPQYDIYVTGSDQIWNVNFRIASRAFFLAFTNDNNKYAFSTSIGRCKEDKLTDYANFIKDYKEIFIREEVGAKRLKNMFPNLKIDTMIDPTLLLNKQQWMKIVDKNRIVNENYIVCYATLDDQLEKMMPILKYISNKYQKRIVLFGMIIPAEENWIDNYVVAGPLEFIRLIRDADLVITNSFHGTAFSINFNVPFLTYNDEFENTRKTGILDIFKLRNRIVHNVEECKNIIDEPIDFQEVNNLIFKERKSALEKIRRCIYD